MNASRWLALLLLLPASLPTAGTELIRLSGSELQAWADAQLNPRAMQPQPLLLAALVNDSATSTDDAGGADHSRSAHERGGVPIALLDALLATQLEASGRYVLVNEAGGDTLPALTVRLVRYQPPHRRGDESGVWQRVRSQWSSWVDLDPQPLGVSLAVSWRDPLANEQRELLIHADSDTCLRLPHAPATASPALADETEAYRRSAIGQASMAAFNRLLGWLDGMHSHDQYRVTVTAVRGQRLRLDDPQGMLAVGQALPLFHRDRPQQTIGQIKIGEIQGTSVDAWPLTLAAGSIRPGDRLYVHRPALGSVILPASAPPGSRCATDTAESAANSHTESQDSLPAEPLPQS